MKLTNTKKSTPGKALPARLAPADHLERDLQERFESTPPLDHSASIAVDHPNLAFRQYYWNGDEATLKAYSEEFARLLNQAYEFASDKAVIYADVAFSRDGVVFHLLDINRVVVYEGFVEDTTIDALNSMRIRRIEHMDAENEKENKAKLRPRWAEEARPKKQVKLRLLPDLIREVDSAASEQGLNRNDWIEESIRKALAAQKPKPK